MSTDDELQSKAPYGPHGQAKSLELPSNTVLKTSDSSIDKTSVKANAEINATKTVQSTFRWPSTIANEADGSLPESPVASNGDAQSSGIHSRCIWFGSLFSTQVAKKHLL